MTSCGMGQHLFKQPWCVFTPSCKALGSKATERSKTFLIPRKTTSRALCCKRFLFFFGVSTLFLVVLLEFLFGKQLPSGHTNSHETPPRCGQHMVKKPPCPVRRRSNLGGKPPREQDSAPGQHPWELQLPLSDVCTHTVSPTALCLRAPFAVGIRYL